MIFEMFFVCLLDLPLFLIWQQDVVDNLETWYDFRSFIFVKTVMKNARKAYQHLRQRQVVCSHVVSFLTE